MPFTFCHPAIILPLTKSKKLSTSALIIGSTAPDFEYFIRMDLIRTHSHDFWAIFYFNLPLTIMLYLIFQLVVKTPLINNLPKFLFLRFNSHLQKRPLFDSYRHFGWVVFSSILGIFSHLLWDSFTHQQGFFEGYLPILLNEFRLFGKDFITFQFLQTWSSIIGGLYILYFVLKMPKVYQDRTQNLIKFWLIAICCAITVIYLRHCSTPQQLIATSISSGFIGLIFSSSFYRLKSIKIKNPS